MVRCEYYIFYEQIITPVTSKPHIPITKRMLNNAEPTMAPPIDGSCLDTNTPYD